MEGKEPLQATPEVEHEPLPGRKRSEIKEDWDTNKLFWYVVLLAVIGWALLLAHTIRVFTS